MNAVICPKCMDKDATVRLDLADGDTLTCAGCEEEYTLADVRELVASWGPLLAWLDTYPRPAAEVRIAAAG